VDAAPLRVLLVEDDERLARLTARYLESHGLVVTWVTSGPAALAELKQRAFDVVLLDLMLPGKDGIEVCRELRQYTDVPVIMLTAREEEADRVIGLDAGADDYMVKPFSSRELLARLQAHVRRARGQVGPHQKNIAVGDLVLEPARLRATLAGRELLLTSYEFALLLALTERAGRVLSREQLLDLAKGTVEDALDRSIDVHISRLRQKLGDDAKRPRLLKTVRGAGYVLTPGENA
jgi:two-component system OmpR family response regulator